jgi:hypothetical protein
MSVEPAAGSQSPKPAKLDSPDRKAAPQEPASATPAPGAKPVTAAPQADSPQDEVDDSTYHRDRFVLFNALPSSLVSALVHFIAFMILALTTFSEPDPGDTLAIQGAPADRADEVDEIQAQDSAAQLEQNVADQQAEVSQQVLQNVVVATDAPTVAVDVSVSQPNIEIGDFSQRTAPKSDLLSQIGSMSGSGLDGRGDAARAKMVATVGGTSESEKAVAQALKWFVEHQNHDGSWSFDHRGGPCQGRCSDPGRRSACRPRATAMALLPFLGAGQTHQQGEYKQVVERGLYYLTNAMRVANRGGMQTGDLAQAGGSMYAHGLAAITLCEAYAMTHDRKLLQPAQLSLNHIMFAQDPVGGGWRYSPRQPGDTSVVGWQLMALKSGHMAYLAVDPKCIQSATRFLDSTAGDGGSRYGYTGPGQGQGTTAVGLLCRMYLGWKRDNPALKRGVEYLSRTRPSPGNMYYNYYATQVLRQYCGDPGTDGHEMWEKWNTEIRDKLVKDQEKTGHQKGSWMMRGDHGSDRGGRLYCTSMATMILEVYYRHMPIYGKQAATEDFPL